MSSLQYRAASGCLGVPESRIWRDSIVSFERPRKNTAHSTVDGTEVENTMVFQRVAHSEATERQCLHTAVRFNSSEFLR